jgi:phosphoadenosine phosphosulfate reductase
MDQFPEMAALRSLLIDSWGVDILTVRNDDVLNQATGIGDLIQVARLSEVNRAALRDIGHTEASFPWISDSPVCNHLLKTLPLNAAVKQYDIAMLLTGIRWDEHSSRTDETYFSARNNPPHMRGQPILHMTERDIWDITFALGIPYCSLYNEGYRSLGTKSATTRPATIPAWKQALESTTERGGRSEEKEKMMAQLRAWGYM